MDFANTFDLGDTQGARAEQLNLRHLASALRLMSGLTLLDMSHCGIDEAGARDLAAPLGTVPAIALSPSISAVVLRYAMASPLSSYAITSTLSSYAVAS
eukprot:3017649-Rhodomonas_salina.2